MMLVRLKSCDNYKTEVLAQEHHYVDIALEELVFFIRRSKAVPFGKPADNTGEIDLRSLKLIGYPDCSYELYSDNGFSPAPEDSLDITIL